MSIEIGIYKYLIPSLGLKTTTASSGYGSILSQQLKETKLGRFRRQPYAYGAGF
jgi:hypothetical protein